MWKGKVKRAKGDENCSVVFRGLQVQNMKCVLFSSYVLHLDSSICSANDCQNTKLCENGPFLACSLVAVLLSCSLWGIFISKALTTIFFSCNTYFQETFFSPSARKVGCHKPLYYITFKYCVHIYIYCYCYSIVIFLLKSPFQPLISVKRLFKKANSVDMNLFNTMHVDSWHYVTF